MPTPWMRHDRPSRTGAVLTGIAVMPSKKIYTTLFAALFADDLVQANKAHHKLIKRLKSRLRRAIRKRGFALKHFGYGKKKDGKDDLVQEYLTTLLGRESFRKYVAAGNDIEALVSLTIENFIKDLCRKKAPEKARLYRRLRKICQDGCSQSVLVRSRHEEDPLTGGTVLRVPGSHPPEPAKVGGAPEVSLATLAELKQAIRASSAWDRVIEACSTQGRMPNVPPADLVTPIREAGIAAFQLNDLVQAVFDEAGPQAGRQPQSLGERDPKFTAPRASKLQEIATLIHENIDHSSEREDTKIKLHELLNAAVTLAKGRDPQDPEGGKKNITLEAIADEMGIAKQTAADYRKKLQQIIAGIDGIDENHPLVSLFLRKRKKSQDLNDRQLRRVRDD